jgi:hypothetical protein
MKDYTAEDKAMRKRLEARSVDLGRAPVVEALNKASSLDSIQKNASLVLHALRISAQGHRRTISALNAAHDTALAKAAAEQSFNRLHPLSRRVPASETTDIPRNERDDARNDRIGPDLRDFSPVQDRDGSMDADAQTRALLFAGQGGRELGAKEFKEQLVLSIEQMHALATAAVQSNRYW